MWTINTKLLLGEGEDREEGLAPLLNAPFFYFVSVKIVKLL